MVGPTERNTRTNFLWNLKWTSVLGANELGLNVVHTLTGNAILQAAGGTFHTGLTIGNVAAAAAVGGAMVSVPSALAAGVVATACNYRLYDDETDNHQLLSHRENNVYEILGMSAQFATAIAAPAAGAAVMGAPLPVVGAVAASSALGAGVVTGAAFTVFGLKVAYDALMDLDSVYNCKEDCSDRLDTAGEKLSQFKDTVINCAPSPCCGMNRGYTTIN